MQLQYCLYLILTQHWNPRIFASAFVYCFFAVLSSVIMIIILWKTIWCSKHRWMGRVMAWWIAAWYIVGKDVGEVIRIQLIDNLLEKKNYTDLKKSNKSNQIKFIKSRRTRWSLTPPNIIQIVCSKNKWHST